MRITEWYEHWQGKVYVSFSGGKDSTVLLDIARSVYSGIEAVFVDTGLEYPEIREFVKQHDNVTWLHPIKYDRMQKKYVRTTYKEVIETYGYPVVSKEISNIVRLAKPGNARWEKMHGTFENTKRYNHKKYQYLLEAPFPISEQCCDAMKKRPAKRYEALTGNKPIIATMAKESALRQTKWLRNGCNSFDGKRKNSSPMSFWTEQDVLAYLKNTGVSYCSVYGDIVASDGECDYDSTLIPSKLHCTGCQRTGCMFCMFGVHLEKEPNRFQRMKITHPKQYDYCINKLGLGEVLDYIGVTY